jgi:hypothetical protein
MKLFDIFRRTPQTPPPPPGGADRKVDLFDLAKPVRDASLAEIERLLSRDQPAQAIADGHRLGTHLVALCIASCSERQRTLEQVEVNCNIHQTFAIAIGMLIGYAGSSFRPIINGRPLTPSQSGHLLMQVIGPCAMEQLVNAENGTLDFNINFVRTPAGEIVAEKFDVMDMLKGKP